MQAALRRMKCAQSAVKANELALAWARARISALGAAPLEAHDGEILVHSVFPS